MCEFIIYYRNRREKRYKVNFNPWPSYNMLVAMAHAMIKSNGGYSCSFSGPNGLHGLVND